MNDFRKVKLLVGLAWRACPLYLVLLVLSSLCSGAQVMANVILPKYLVDELVGGLRISYLAAFGGAIVGSNLLFGLLGGLLKRHLDVRREETSLKMTLALSDKIMRLPYPCLETPHVLDLKERASFAITNQGALDEFISQFAELVKNAVTLAGLLAVLFAFSWVLVALLAATIGIQLLIQKRFAKYRAAYYRQVLPVNRRYGYYVDLAFDDVYQKDIRLYGMEPMVADRVWSYNREIFRWASVFKRREGLVAGLGVAVGALQSALVYGCVGLRVATAWRGPRIGLGSFSMYTSAAVSFTMSVGALGNSWIALGAVLEYLDPFAELMSLADEEDCGTEPFAGEFRTIEFREVSFRYPNCEALVLDEVSFSVREGEKISVVGLNGAGKTTLIKLLCGLYRPVSGEILVNGTDISRYRRGEYLAAIAAVFQDYKLFDFTVWENITARPLGEGNARHCAQLAGIAEKIESLPKGYASRIGQELDEEGVEFSGGERQKLAIARALCKSASLIILDEPTSALDPFAEAEIYENFNELAGERTAFYISHRMSSSQFCDRILVLDGGRVADFATHAELMHREGLYRTLFLTQSQNYRH